MTPGSPGRLDLQASGRASTDRVGGPQSRPCQIRSRARCTRVRSTDAASSSAEAIVQVDHGMLQTGPVEQPGFGGAVALHGPVIVQVIARKIGEQRVRESHTVHPALVEPVGGDFHGDAARALRSSQSARCFLHRDRVRRGVRGRRSSPGKPIPNVPITAGRRPSDVRRLRDPVRAGSLAVGAGHPGDPHACGTDHRRRAPR